MDREFTNEELETVEATEEVVADSAAVEVVACDSCTQQCDSCAEVACDSCAQVATEVVAE